MFGYVTIARDKLAKDRQERYRSFYCGLCRTLRLRHGSLSRISLSFDMTFLYILLSSLYEPVETCGKERCAPHMLRPHGYVDNPFAQYCADMNIALAYHKCRDDWQDEHSFVAGQGERVLRKAYQEVRNSYGEKCICIEECLEEINRVEKLGKPEPDLLANLTGKLLGVVYRWREDEWADSLQHMGEALGRFIYLMDAYEDLEKDQRYGRYNPLVQMSRQEGFEEICLDGLKWMIGECAEEFESLPLIQDADIMRNVLYSGCWMRYDMKQGKKMQKKRRSENERSLSGTGRKSGRI